jgi:hypothetical protein
MKILELYLKYRQQIYRNICYNSHNLMIEQNAGIIGRVKIREVKFLLNQFVV